MELRARRIQVRRHGAARRWARWLAIGGAAVAAWGAASVLPSLAPANPAAAQPGVPTAVSPALLSLAQPASAAAAVTPTTLPLPLLAPTAAPTPVIDTAFLNTVRSDLAAQWVKNDRETPLRSGPDPAAITFTTLPQWTMLRVTGQQAGWLQVSYSGDGETRQPGPGWVAAADVGPVGTPTEWLVVTRAGVTVWADTTTTSARREDVPAGIHMEVLTTGPSIQGNRIHVRLPGDGRFVLPAEGWVAASGLAVSAALGSAQIPWAYPADLTADLRLPVRYRTQLDGTDYAEANCGPTALGMALEAFGVNLTPAAIRSQVMVSQGGDPSDVDNGSFIWSLDKVAHQDGLQTYGLYASDGTTMQQWSTDDVKQQLTQGRPVILQVRYRYLPLRGDSLYYGDHYIIITGLIGTNFLYDDPIGTPAEGPGYDREISPSTLQRAMNASDHTYAYTGFAVSKAG